MTIEERKAYHIGLARKDMEDRENALCGASLALREYLLTMPHKMDGARLKLYQRAVTEAFEKFTTAKEQYERLVELATMT